MNPEMVYSLNPSKEALDRYLIIPESSNSNIIIEGVSEAPTQVWNFFYDGPETAN
jgi:hypothetical protein